MSRPPQQREVKRIGVADAKAQHPLRQSLGVFGFGRLHNRQHNSLRFAGLFRKETNMASEKMRVVAFDTVDLDDGDWDGPTAHGEFLTYTSKHAAASIRVTKGGKVVLDGDYGAKKTVLIDDDVIHLPEGIGKEL
jgi:hypothetical protein